MKARQTPLTCSGHTRPVVDLSFSPVTSEGIFLISACKDGNPMLRNGQTGDWIGTFFGHKGAVWSASLNQLATKAVTASADFTSKLWDARTGDEMATYEHKHIVRTAILTSDEQKLLTGGHEKKLRIFDVEKKNEIHSLEGHISPIKCVRLKEDANMIFSSGEEKEIRIWDLRTQNQVGKCVLANNVTSLDVSPNLDFLVSTSGKAISFWDLKSMSMVKEIPTSFNVDSASLHLDGSRVVAGGSDFYLHIYDFNDGRELEVYKGHHGPVHCVKFSPDGELYVSGSEDGTIRLWQTKPGNPYGLWQGIQNGKDEGAEEIDPHNN